MPGKQYEFRISEERLSLCPKWDIAKDQNPPCSAALALSTSEKFFLGLSEANSRKDQKWWFDSLALVKVGEQWAWKATYEFWPRNGRRMGMAASLNCWILMDGKIVKPTVIDDKNKAEQAGTGQPATRPESKSEASDKPQPESEGRSR